MKKIIALFTISLFCVATIMATGPIQKKHNDAADGKGKRTVNGVKVAMNCAYCHGDKNKPKSTWPAGVMTTVKAEVKGYKKDGAKFAELKNNALCNECHK